MTKNEILNMEAGREMDALVAEKVMGEKETRPNGIVAEYVKHYSTDIAAAWEVVEKMWSIRLGFQIIRWPSPTDGEDWNISFGNGQQGIEAAQGNTAPIAICRAALLAVMEEQ